MSRAGRRLTAVLAVVASVACAPSASAMEAPTPQAVAANATFLAYAPPPPTPVKVCVVDTGVDLTTDAAPAVVERYSVFGGTTDDVGGSGLEKHGTLVAGVIASQLDGRDSVGIWPQARIVSVRVFAGSGGGTTTSATVAALDLCRERGAKVINLSMSGLDQATGEELAWLEDNLVVMRKTRDITVVAGSGNNGGQVGYPARFSAVLGVGASDAAGTLCSFSNRGAGLDIAALGCAAELSWPGGGIGFGTGTSYAAPVVSGVLAALRAYRPELTAAESESMLLSTAVHGHVDAGGTFEAAGLGWLVSSRDQTRAGAQVRSRSCPCSPEQALLALGVHAPVVRAASYRRGILVVRVSGLPDFGRAVFRVDGRIYRRGAGELRLRLRRRPRVVSVLIDVPGVGRTPSTRAVMSRPLRRELRNSSTRPQMPTAP